MPRIRETLGSWHGILEKDHESTGFLLLLFLSLKSPQAKRDNRVRRSLHCGERRNFIVYMNACSVVNAHIHYAIWYACSAYALAYWH